jgi:hypothetical protein
MACSSQLIGIGYWSMGRGHTSEVRASEGSASEGRGHFEIISDSWILPNPGSNWFQNSKIPNKICSMLFDKQ